jgi:hypothetical protein
MSTRGYYVLPNNYYGGYRDFDTEGMLPAGYVFQAPSQNILDGNVYGFYRAGAWLETPTPPPAIVVPAFDRGYGWYKSREFLREFNRGDRKTILESTDNIVQDAVRLLQINGVIDFADEDMRIFMDQLVTLGVINNGKKNRIYAGARFTEVP